MISEIQKVVSIVVAVLTSVLATTGADLSHVSPLISKVIALLTTLTGLRSPTSVDVALADLVTALGALKSSGLISNTAAIDEALTIIGKFQAVEADYRSGQVALIDSNFSFAGIRGDLIAIAKGGAAAATLGL